MSDSDDPVVDVSAVLNSEDVPQIESSSEIIVEELPAPVVEEVPDPVVEEAPTSVSEAPTSVGEAPSVTTEEVVENVKEMLTSDPPAKSTEERLNALIELLKGTVERVEYDDDKYRWVGPLVNIREELNEL